LVKPVRRTTVSRNSRIGAIRAGGASRAQNGILSIPRAVRVRS
jgi:hypothetical protein